MLLLKIAASKVLTFMALPFSEEYMLVPISHTQSVAYIIILVNISSFLFFAILPSWHWMKSAQSA